MSVSEPAWQRSTPPRRVLYVGDLNPRDYGTCQQRLEAMRDLGHQVVGIDTPYYRGCSRPQKLWRQLRRRFLKRAGDRNVTRQILEHLRREPFDILWLDKPLPVETRVFREATQIRPGLRIVGYAPDDMMNPANQSREFLDGLRYYDVFFTTKSYNVAELEGLGCPRAVFVGNAYHPALHRPVELSAEERERLGGPVGFIGTAEQERANSIAHLARNGIPVKVWGDHWEDFRARSGTNYTVAGRSQYGETYTRIICAFDINLGFLRKVNRDLQTQRSIEIPACGAFMLAERSNEHLELFEEGKEAEFFSSDDELLDKVRYYLAHPDQRRAIAEAGRQRCIRSGYSNQARIDWMLAQVDAITSGQRADAGEPIGGTR